MTDPAMIKQAVKEAMHEEMQPFFIDRETHYQDHLFIKELKEFMQTCKSTMLKTFVRFFAILLIGALIAGFTFKWLKD